MFDEGSEKVRRGGTERERKRKGTVSKEKRYKRECIPVSQ